MNAPATQPKPTPPPVATTCPHCHRDLAANQRGSHCPPPRKPCGWIICSCRAVVDPSRGSHSHPQDHGKPHHLWPCNQQRAAA